jgi:acyl-CoA reductase-like NAD-dependent aldehyde dehydrogenase
MMGDGSSSLARTVLLFLLKSLDTAEERLSSTSASSAMSPTLLTSLVVLLPLLALIKMLVDNQWRMRHQLQLWWEFVALPVPKIHVDINWNVGGNGYRQDEDKSTKSKNGNSNSTTMPLLDPQQPGWIQCYNPATGDRLGRVPRMTAADVDVVIQKASMAQTSWRQTTFAQRRRVLRTLQQYIVHNVDTICQVASLDSGKPVVDACLGEVLTTCEKIRTIVAHGEVWLQPSVRAVPPLLLHKTAYVEYMPLGVIATIAPWNYPFHNLTNHVISALFAGNAIVCKASEHTSWSVVAYFAEMVRQALSVNGHDASLCGTITGMGDAGAALVSHPLVDKVIFTGSPAVGRLVMRAAAEHVKPVILELGGKDAMVVMHDTKLPEVMPWVLRGCYQNAGQNCVGVERVLVYESIHDDFIAAIRDKVQNLRQGCPVALSSKKSSNMEITDTDCGAMVTGEQCALIQSLIDDAVQKGATIVVGGKRGGSGSGFFFQPTILTGVTTSMRIFREEVFGPVMTVVKVPHDDDAECLRLVNDSPFGLSSSVFCGSPKRGLALGRQFRTGMLCINDFGSNYLVQSLPFGGVGESGFGRFAGPEGLQALCLERSILVDRFPNWTGIKTTIPPPINYPIDKNKGLPFCDGLIQLFYNESWLGKIKGIFGLIKNG